MGLSRSSERTLRNGAASTLDSNRRESKSWWSNVRKIRRLGDRRKIRVQLWLSNFSKNFVIFALVSRRDFSRIALKRFLGR